MHNSNLNLSSRVYLDHNATTPLFPVIVQKLPEIINEWGNPSSVHLQSRGPKTILRETRKKIAEYLNCSQLEIIFNSGASEGNNTVLKSVWEKLGHQKNHFLVSSVEHPSVIKAAQYLKTLGAHVQYIPVDRNGVIDIEFIKNNLNENTALVSCMYANNETGAIFPIQEISKIVKAHGSLFHVDCVQVLGKIKINLSDLEIDYATFSAHKFYALKGCGILFVRKNSPYVNLIHGGGQERSRRGGTENILAIASLGVMLQELEQLDFHQNRIEQLRNFMEEEILASIPQVSITCENNKRLANTSSLIIEGVDGETLLMSLDIQGFSVSTGAACSSGSPEPSPVLLAIGLTPKEAQNSLRISLGWMTTQTEIEKFLKCLQEVVHRIRDVQLKELV